MGWRELLFLTQGHVPREVIKVLTFPYFFNHAGKTKQDKNDEPPRVKTAAVLCGARRRPWTSWFHWTCWTFAADVFHAVPFLAERCINQVHRPPLPQTRIHKSIDRPLMWASEPAMTPTPYKKKHPSSAFGLICRAQARVPLWET